MVNHKYTEYVNIRVAIKPICRNKIKHCVEMNTQTNWLTDTNLIVDSRIMRTVEFTWIY